MSGLTMRDSKTYQMVSWLHKQGDRGATMNEVAAAFGLDPTHAHGLMGAISRRCYCKVKLNDSVNPRRYVVTWIDKEPCRNGVARPVVGVHAKGMVVQYPSAAAAQDEGGFCARAIRYVLSGRQRTHAGYQWAYAEVGSSKS